MQALYNEEHKHYGPGEDIMVKQKEKELPQPPGVGTGSVTATSIRLRDDLLFRIKERQLERRRERATIKFVDIVHEALEQWLQKESGGEVLQTLESYGKIEGIEKIPAEWLADLARLADLTGKDVNRRDLITDLLHGFVESQRLIQPERKSSHTPGKVKATNG